MRRRLAILSVIGLLGLAVIPARTAGASSAHGRILGVVPAGGAAAVRSHPIGYSSNGLGNLQYWGGSVQTGTHHTYAIYWGGGSGTSFDPSYQANINQYFTDVAADSGKTSNVYYSDTQYYQSVGGVKTYIKYSEQFSGSWQDSSAFPASGCSDTSGGSICVTDAQIQAEVTKAIQTNGWPTGSGSEYFVFLGNGASTCTDSTNSECAFSYFCAYHSSYTNSSGQTVLYANMPYAGHNLSACGGGNYPNNPNSDATINVTSHEANETVTDYLGNAWYDWYGYENGDKCAWIFGPVLGGSSGAYYDQVINGHHYELQGEYSNYSRNCVWRNR
ncbi:MAG: hypothetical protein JOZ41_03905 [Chloroflexi bacterium]|nr:hypothetical protein [Chloroflexota bacterium]